MAPKVKTKGSRHNPPLTHDRCFPSPGPHNSPPLSPHNEHISHPRFPHLSKALQAAFLSRVGPHKQTQSAEPIKQLLKDVGGSLERWNQKWRRSLDGWWGGVPGGGVMERCGAFLSGVLASRFQSWIGRNRLSGGAVAPPPAPTNDAAGCEEAHPVSPICQKSILLFYERPPFPHMSHPVSPTCQKSILLFRRSRSRRCPSSQRALERRRGYPSGSFPWCPSRASSLPSSMLACRSDGLSDGKRTSRWRRRPAATEPVGCAKPSGPALGFL